MKLKPYLRWVIVGGTLFFLLATVRSHWQEVAAVRIRADGWRYLGLAFGFTLGAHIWSGWVWGWILEFLGQSSTARWSISTYLTTNLAKYLPGNVWHYYGRIMASKAIGIPFEAATLSVLLEPLLMAASALMLALLTVNSTHGGVQLLALLGVLIAVHPRVLNLGISLLRRSKASSSDTEESTPALQLKRYPLAPLLGELGFVVWRGMGFVFTLMALMEVSTSQIPKLLGGFSASWLLGLVVPGAPGGMGVFEVTAIALLKQDVAVGVLLSGVALYRMISILAEILGAGIAWIYTRRV